MTHVAQALAELAQALASPQQRRLRCASRLWLDQRAQVIEQACIRLAQRLATPAHPAHSLHIWRFASTQFGQPTSDRATRTAVGAHHRNTPAMSGRRRLGARKTPSPAFIEQRSERLKARAYGR